MPFVHARASSWGEKKTVESARSKEEGRLGGKMKRRSGDLVVSRIRRHLDWGREGAWIKNFRSRSKGGRGVLEHPELGKTLPEKIREGRKSGKKGVGKR